MKLIAKSNFDLEGVDDILIAENVHPSFGKYIVNLLIKNMREDDTYFYKLVEDDYELYKFEP